MRRTLAKSYVIMVLIIVEPINHFRGSPLNLYQTFNVLLEIERPGLYNAIREMRSDISFVENRGVIK